MTELSRLEQAERMLADIATTDDAVAMINMAEAARVMARQARLGTSAVNHATVIKLRAERRLADLVDEGQRRGEIASLGTNQHDLTGSSDSEDPPTTLQEIGVLPRQVHEARVVRDHYTDDDLSRLAQEHDARDRVLSRDRLLRRARDASSLERTEDKARRTVQAMALPPDVDLRTGDFREVLADLEDGSVDAIITDPPYPKEYLELFEELAAFADRVLTEDGVLAVMSGQTHLPMVFDLMCGHRDYRWTMACLTPGAGYASHARRLQSHWKPVLVYGGGPRFDDVIAAEAPDKRLHVWGQDLGAFATLVERLTEPGALVCDPFVGGGTTAVAARDLGRRFVGCDVDPAAAAMALERVEVPA